MRLQTVFGQDEDLAITKKRNTSQPFEFMFQLLRQEFTNYTTGRLQILFSPLMGPSAASRARAVRSLPE